MRLEHGGPVETFYFLVGKTPTDHLAHGTPCHLQQGCHFELHFMKFSGYISGLIGSTFDGGGVGTDFREINKHPLFPFTTLANLGCQWEKTEKRAIY